MKKNNLIKIIIFCIFFAKSNFSYSSEFNLKINTYKDFSNFLFIKNNLFLTYLTIENSLNLKTNIDFEEQNHLLYKGFEVKLVNYDNYKSEYLMSYNIKNLTVFEVPITLKYIKDENVLFLEIKKFKKIPDDIKNKIKNKISLYQNEETFELIYQYLQSKKGANLKNSIFFDYYKNNLETNNKKLQSSEKKLGYDTKISMFLFFIMLASIIFFGIKFRKLKF